MASRPTSAADLGDRHRRFAAFAFLCLGIIFAADAAGDLLGAGAAPWLRGVERTAGVLTLLALAPMVLWKVRNRSRSALRMYAGEGGVVLEHLHRANLVSWVVTLLTLMVLERLAERWPDLPAEFFVEAGLAVMVSSFAVCFLVLDREPDQPPVTGGPGA